jgi:hypothetical protein
LGPDPAAWRITRIIPEGGTGGGTSRTTALHCSLACLCNTPPARPPAVTPAPLAPLRLQPAGRLSAADRRTLEPVLQAKPLLAQGYQRKTRVQPLLAERHVGTCEPWLDEAETADLPALRALARSVRRDAEASLATLTTPWSTGPWAGQLGRVTRLTRLGAGRAKGDRLRPRLWHRMPRPVRLGQQRREIAPPAAA